MYFKQFFLGCLAHASYLIGAEGEACIVDPQRDVDQYIEEAQAQGLKIKYILETHLHADFVSGHCELAKRTGAEIVMSEMAEAAFDHKSVKDNDILHLGKSVTIKVIATPGHTVESVCYLVQDESDKASPAKLLTGDTLFIGDVGRPDLVSGHGMSSEDMASMLYDSLHNKLLKLNDETEVYPAHGAGSLCGKSMSSERSSTIGIQKQFNYALKAMPKNEFVSMMCTDLPEIPAYFKHAVKKNKHGASHLEDLNSPVAMSVEETKKAISEGYVVLDVRPASIFGEGHIPQAINIGLGGQFASWAGQVIPIETPMIIVADDKEAVQEAFVRLSRAGHDTATGYLEDGMYAWNKAGMEVAKIEQISVNELFEKLEKKEDLKVIDVRRVGEWNSGHVPGAPNMPLSDLDKTVNTLDKKQNYAVICAGGYRSSIATTILRRNGVNNVINITGGTGAWVKSGLPTEKSESSSTSAACVG